MRFQSIMALALVALCSKAEATMIEQLDTSRMTQKSGRIHIGQVLESWASKSSNGMIYTYVRMRIDQTLKGQPSEEVLIRVPGGQTQDTGMVVHGAVQFRQSERALVFLEPDAENTTRVVGMSQGKFKIIKNLVNGQDMALFQAPKNVEFFNRGMRQVISTTEDRRIPLEELMKEIHDEVAQEGSTSH